MNTTPIPNRGLDERQLAIRNRIVTWAFGITLVVAWANGAIVDRWGAWGSATDQALTQLWLALALIAIPSIWRGAYFRDPRDRRTLTILSAAVTVLAAAGTLLKAAGGRLRLWHDGHTGPDYQLAVMGGYFALITLALLVRRLADRWHPNDEE